MDILEVEVLPKESLTKSAKKKKDLDGQVGKNVRKISDFFKTPEKQVEKQRQKSLIQFFGKQDIGEDKKEENIVIATSDDVLVNGTDVTTPTNSDKENNEVLDNDEANTENGETKSKLNKKPKTADSEGSNSGQQLNDKEINDTKRHKKHKKKRKTKDEKTELNMSDSVILLSDSSSSNFSFLESTDKLKETEVGNKEMVSDKDVANKCISWPREKKVKGEVDKDKEVKRFNSVEHKKIRNEIEMETEEVKTGAHENNSKAISKGKTYSLFKERNHEKQTKQESSEETKTIADTDKITENIKDKETFFVKHVDKDKNKKLEKSTKIKESTESKIKKSKLDSINGGDKTGKQVEKEVVGKTRKTEPTCAPSEILDNGKKKSKKSTLKGKDMLNLLKEIQSGESEEKNKRKHKKKHKHHKAKDKPNKEVLEIAVSEDNSDGKEEVKVVDEDNEDEKRTDNEIFNEAGKRVTRRRSKIVNDVKDIIEEEEESNLKEVANKNHKHKKSKGSKDLDNDPVTSGSKQISYKDFTDTLDSKTSKEQAMKKENVIKEMSYTEYLEMVEKSNVDEKSVDLMESDTDNVTEPQLVDDDDEIDLEVIDNDSAKVEKDVEKCDSKKFFTFMTSTPDREKLNKKTGKVVGKRGRKPKAEKITSSVSSEVKNKQTIELIKTKKMDVDVDVEVTDAKEEKQIHSEGIKCDVSSKNLFCGKKTQATLSFGKSGLTVSKAITKSDEEESKDKTSEIVSNDKVEKPSTNEGEGIKAPPRKRGRKPKQNINEALNASDSSVFATPEKVIRKGKRQLEDDESESGDNDDRRRSLRKRYKVEAFQMDADKKTPIKIKLKRCPKSSSSGEDVDKSALNLKKVKPTVNQTTALALLEKAKRGRLKKHKIKKDKEIFSLEKHKEAKKLKKNLKKRNASNSSEDSLTRRSSRLEGKCMASMEEVSLENIVISSSDDEDENVKIVRKRGRPKGSKNVKSDIAKNVDEINLVDNKGTPKKDVVKKKVGTPSKSRTPSKKGSKLAPMFLMGKNKVAEPSPKKPPLDPELVKQRQQFLMSGVPEALRKQTATRIASQVDADYPPLPRTSHVLQIPKDQILVQRGTVNVWDLNPVELGLRYFIIPFIIHPHARFTGDLIARYDKKPDSLSRIVNYKPPVPISDDMVELCKGEIASFNSTYPVIAMYKAVKEMKIETERPPPKSESMLKTDMTGILDGCTDMMVIDDEKEEQGKRKKKKSLKLQKRDKIEEKNEEPKVEDKCKAVGSSLLWTEKYCPSKTAEVLGNSGVLKKLKTWLTEWKHLLDKEARKARKLMMKKNKGKQLNKKCNDDLWDDGSDFEMDSDDSDDDDSLCNTMLLSGPHGCGKTSSVYALALELGFKVHEVNASSCRSGRQILTQLQEATQSHQVSSQGNHTPRKNTALGDKPKPENKMPTAFTNLFKKAAPSDDSKQEEKPAGRKRKRHKSDKDGNTKTKGEKKEAELKHKSLQLIIEDSNSQSVAKSLNLSSTTLILFDEVDVVFDEDKGFLSAIQSFMSKTKIPIILTTADPGFTGTFEGRYEQMIFKRPSVASITSHLQTVSLVENVRTDPLMFAEMAQFYNCDMRRCLITLQYLLESGGGHVTSSRVISAVKDRTKTANLLGLETENSQSCSQSDTVVTENRQVTDTIDKDVDNSDDDFVSIKPSRKRRRVLEDESSNSVDACSKVVTPVMSESIPVETNEECKNYPLVHSLGLESLISASSICIADMLSQGLKAKTESTLQEMICTSCYVKQNSGSDLFYNNLHCILPFTSTVVDSVFKPSQVKSKSKTRQRIRIESDLYDSEASNDASKVEDTAESKGDNLDNLTNVESSKQGCKEENLCLAKSLSYFTEFYDTMSSLDMLEAIDTKKVCDKLKGFNGRDVKGTLVSGMGNELAKFPTHCELDLETSKDYSSEIGTRSMCKMYSSCGMVKEEVEKLCKENETFEENFILPVNRQNEHFTLVDNNVVSIPVEYKRACDNTVDNLPLVSHSHLRSVHLDYLPTLREICRTEQCRQVTNTKRRFHHYLDSITLPLKDRTISTLATTFV